MAKNDIILLDSIIKSEQTKFWSYDLSEVFEIFCFDQVLKDYDISFEDIESGWVDWWNDQWIDGIYVFIDQSIVLEKPNGNIRNNPNIELIIITCKHADTFRQEPVNNLLSISSEFLDISKSNDQLRADYNDDVLRIRELFIDTYLELLTKNPTLTIKYKYCCRAWNNQIPENIKSKSDLLIEQTSNFFSDSHTEFEYVSSEQLLELYRKKKTYSLRLKFVEQAVSKEGYVILVKLSDFYSFITDEGLKLRKYLFESNVRDYLWESWVNKDIEWSLMNQWPNIDFWWLNNWVTIIASSIKSAGKELSLENIHIVNWLQTTETIYKYFSTLWVNKVDDRTLLIKIIQTDNELIRDSIIKATNNQSPVDPSSLRAMDKIQRDIEQLLFENDYYYDRRKNYYKNIGKSPEKIISLSYLWFSITALCLWEIKDAADGKTRFFRDDSKYNKVFNTSWNIWVFLRVVQIQKSIDLKLKEYWFKWKPEVQRKTMARSYRFMFSYLFCVTQLKKVSYGPNELLSINVENINDEILNQLWEFILSSEENYVKDWLYKWSKFRKSHRNKAFLDYLKDESNKLS
jgi:hypothetical protein